MQVVSEFFCLTLYVVQMLKQVLIETKNVYVSRSVSYFVRIGAVRMHVCNV